MTNRFWASLALTLYASLTACAQNSPIEAFAPRLARPTEGQVVVAENVIIVADASGSLDRSLVLPQQKAFLESFVGGMPPGTYQVAFQLLGGRERHQQGLEKFDRFELKRRVEEIKWTGRETPLALIFSNFSKTPPIEPQKNRLILFSDGVPTRYGRYIGPDEALDAAEKLVASWGPEICIHTVELGTDPRGPALLKALSALTDCGSYHRLNSLENASALYVFQQEIFNGPQPPPREKKARRVIDLDKDRVDDQFDRCPNTPIGANVDTRGCWVIVDTVFQTGSSGIRLDQRAAIDHAVVVLKANPTLRIRIDGHTDDTGSAEYNFNLAQERATSVRQHIAAEGIMAERLEVRSFGANRPIAGNDTKEGRKSNRRVELSVLDY